MRQHLTAVGRQLSSSFWRQAAGAQCTCSFATNPAATSPPQHSGGDTVDVPAGHENSDMRNSICNISLNRRRDISLRTDIKLFCDRDDKPIDLRELLRNKNLDEVLLCESHPSSLLYMINSA